MFKVGDRVRIINGPKGIDQGGTIAGKVGKQFTVTRTDKAGGKWYAVGNEGYAQGGIYFDNLELVTKAVAPGDMVEITRYQNGASVGDIVKVVRFDSAGNITYEHPKSHSGTFVADAGAFKLVGRAEDQNTDPAPVLFADYAESKKAFKVVSTNNKEITINSDLYDFNDNKKASHNAGRIYMQVGGGYAASLSIEQAKEVAVALFNQILYHEGVRNGEISS